MRSLSASFQHMNRVLHGEDAAGLSDAELVCRFVEHRDEMAFSALVRRYGVIVLGVCRRVLRHEQDAEDAFQATFLILAQKAVSIRRPGEIGNWLYGVAYNVARKAKAYRQRREVKEQAAAAQQSPAIHEGMWNELQEILDHELCALTDKYRTPIVLCDIRGLTIQEAAAELGCPPKTLGTRLSRGRSLLAGRLTRRGVVVSVGTLATALSSSATGAATAAISPRLLDVTIHAAIGFAADSAVAISPKVTALTKGVSNVMVLKSLKYVGVMACCVLISSGLVRHFSAQAATMPNAQSRELSGQGTASQAKHVTPPKPFNHLDHIHKLIDHLLDWTGIGRNEVEDSAIASTDDK
ncbi:MAG TPA: RNA polymerase sigma factor, partial [Gemmata sp.]|nr:RNA polymerase sigma factor [Gemmata sp.]